MQSKRWSSYTAWLAILVLLSATASAAHQHHHGRALHPSAPADVVARQPLETQQPQARSPPHRVRQERRRPAPTPLSPDLQRRLSQVQAARAPSRDRSPAHQARLADLFGPGTTTTAASDVTSSELASSSSAAADSISSSIAASISKSIADASATSAAIASSSSAAAAAAAASSSRADASASKAAASAASASASAYSANLAAASSSLAALSASIAAQTVTSFTTAAATTPTAPADTAEPDNSDGHTSLIIGVSVVGGAALLGLAAFLYMKFANKPNHYDDDDADIKWPELRSEGDASAMHPLPARRTGGAGFEMAGESEVGHDRDMVEDGGYGRESFSGSTTALGMGAGGAAGYGAYGNTGVAGTYHDADATGPAPGYGPHTGYYDQYGQPTAGGYSDTSNPYADAHAASPYGNVPPATQAYYGDGSSVVAGSDPHAAANAALSQGQGHYGQDMYGGQQTMMSPTMQATHTGYGRQM
ncbi:hypothetical protein CF319_g1543 [Tilletia indica]|uniref:Mid2 domain-containing protein n=1 Tax=Tilletia indica TaxID=43049 RepID=A0A177TTW7_9BASI|nr:hypothetical protein CF319_g1543 [Tilletia indica]KAE8257177.1 hypothetical protein A4X13_0g2536 [Tilletia indica]